METNMSVIYTPFAWVLRLLYSVFQNYGLALIAFALIIALIRLPFDMRQKRSMMRTSLLQPRMNALKEKHGENTPKYNEELSKLYKEEGVNPMSGCIWSIIPLALLIVLYTVVRKPLTYLMGLTDDQITQVAETLGSVADSGSAWYQIYLAKDISANYEALKAVVDNVINLKFTFLGMDLGEVPSFKIWEISSWSGSQIGLFFLPLISAILSVFSQRLATATSFQQQDPNTSGMMKGMTFISPVISLWIGFSYPAALSIYWLANNLFTMISTFFTNRHFKKIFEVQKAEREAEDKAKEAEREKKRKETERLRAMNATTKNPSTSKKKAQKAERQQEQERLAGKKEKKPKPEEEEASRSGDRRYARGRAYSTDRFDGAEDAEETSPEETDDERLDEPDDDLALAEDVDIDEEPDDEYDPDEDE